MTDTWIFAAASWRASPKCTHDTVTQISPPVEDDAALFEALHSDGVFRAAVDGAFNIAVNFAWEYQAITFSSGVNNSERFAAERNKRQEKVLADLGRLFLKYQAVLRQHNQYLLREVIRLQSLFELQMLAPPLAPPYDAEHSQKAPGE